MLALAGQGKGKGKENAASTRAAAANEAAAGGNGGDGGDDDDDDGLVGIIFADLDAAAVEGVREGMPVAEHREAGRKALGL